MELPFFLFGVCPRRALTSRMIWFNGFPFLDKKEEHSFGVPVSAVMITDLILLPSAGLKLDEIETILSETEFGGFPIVADRDSKVLLGYIGRTELRYAIGIPPTDPPLSPSPSPPSRLHFVGLRLGLTGRQTERNDCGEFYRMQNVILRLPPKHEDTPAHPLSPQPSPC